MPDWTYHPFFKPLLFRIPAEDGRRLTLGLLEVQARTAVGRRIFRLFGHGLPPEKLAVDAFGIRFPGPIGLAPGIDTDGTAASVMQYLGFGFVQVGPVGATALPRRYAHDPLRVPDRHAIVSSMIAGGASAAEVAARIAALREIRVPIGVALRGDDLERALEDASARASFFSLPPSAAEDLSRLAALRRATERPLLLRISPDWDPEHETRVLEAAVEAGIDGCVALSGTASPLVAEGRVTGPFLLARSLAAIDRIAHRFGDRLPIMASGGIMTPDDAVACLDAGARLVELYEGLIYAGPGLPGRIVHLLEHHASSPPRKPERKPKSVRRKRRKPSAAPESPKLASRPFELGRWLCAATGWILVASGAFALVLAATVKLLPYDEYFLGMTVEELCSRQACRVVHFMAHDRVSFGGSIVSIGALYVWLAGGPLRRREAWAWWLLVVSGAVGFASFLTYLGYGYLDVWHGRATMALLPCFWGGLALCFPGLERPRGPRGLFRPGAWAWIWSPAGMGRACITFSAIGMILGGATILTVGITRVFVPQDLEYMNITVAELRAWNPRLVPLIAHDRAGFGGGLFSGGLTVLFSLWCGAKPGARGLWWALLASGVVGFGCAIGVHPIVGYVSFTHLAPAYAGAIAFVVGIILLYRPMCRADAAAKRFPEV